MGLHPGNRTSKRAYTPRRRASAPVVGTGAAGRPPCPIHRRERTTNEPPLSTRAFTLPEAFVGTLVLGAIGASVMVGMGGADEIQGALDSARRHAQLAQAQGVYINNNMGQYAGVNTSGAIYQAQGIVPGVGVVDASDFLLGDTSSSTPTQAQDWISPIMGDTVNLGANRAMRMANILNKLGDPRATRFNDVLFGTTDDTADFETVFATVGFRQVSFLQPRSFQVYSSRRDDVPFPPTDLIKGAINVSRVLKTEHSDTPALVPIDFEPNINNVGVSLASKVMHADGTRFYSNVIGLDVDTSTHPEVNGAFVDFGPIAKFSTAYGRDAVGSAPGNIELSFRGRDGSMLAAMFDGSVRSFTRQQAWTDPTPWYPSGSTFTGSNATPESIDFAAKNFLPSKDGLGVVIP